MADRSSGVRLFLRAVVIERPARLLASGSSGIGKPTEPSRSASEKGVSGCAQWGRAKLRLKWVGTRVALRMRARSIYPRKAIARGGRDVEARGAAPASAVQSFSRRYRAKARRFGRREGGRRRRLPSRTLPDDRGTFQAYRAAKFCILPRTSESGENRRGTAGFTALGGLGALLVRQKNAPCLKNFKKRVDTGKGVRLYTPHQDGGAAGAALYCASLERKAL